MYMISHYLQNKIYVFEVKYNVPCLKRRGLCIALSIILLTSLGVELKFMFPVFLHTWKLVLTLYSHPRPAVPR
jgi:hypothetical protein